MHLLTFPTTRTAHGGTYQLLAENTARLHGGLHAWADCPFDVMQIDDGRQQALGEWDANDHVPDSMAAPAHTIHALGFRVRRELAPFIVDASLRLPS
nr:hypothetical protein [Ardenticatena sp.]